MRKNSFKLILNVLYSLKYNKIDMILRSALKLKCVEYVVQSLVIIHLQEHAKEFRYIIL